MSANGRYLLSKVVETRDLHPLLAASISHEHFPNPLDRKVFDALLDANTRFGSLPSVKTLKMDYPDYKFVKVDDEIDLLIERVHRDYIGTVLAMTINAAAEGYDSGEFEVAQNSLEMGLKTLSKQTGQTLRVTDLLSLAEKWEDDRTNKKAGIPFGITEIDEETGGIMDDQFIVLIGPPGSGKSAHLLNMAKAASDKGFRALFVTIEMSDEHHLARIVANMTGIPYKTIRRGQPNDLQKHKIRGALTRIHDEGRLIIQEVPAELASLPTINDLIAKHNPDVIYVDGAYLMQLPNVRANAAQWERLSELTRGMKNVILKNHRPIAISTQVLTSKMPGGEVTAASTGYSSSFHQDADIMIGIQPDAELEDRQVVKLLKFRDGGKPSVHIKWDWQTYTLSTAKDMYAEGGEAAGF